MRCSLVVTTYERPVALARVLASVARQSRWPDEVVVAEDGSDAATDEVVRAFARASRCPVRHVTQPHEGFRAGRIRNAAVAAAGGDYVILLDGDMVAHPDFVAEHVSLARRGRYSQGVRILLDAGATQALIEGRAGIPGPFARGLGGARRAYGVHAPALSALLRDVAGSVIAVKSCNQGFWRSDLLAANGFDETMIGWGSEDKELCARLENAGVRRQTLLFAAIAFHLAHEPASRGSAKTNRARWRETVRSGRTRCDRGIDQHLPP
jgi:glycosyltransferase involved in cell wall biosynthesis